MKTILFTLLAIFSGTMPLLALDGPLQQPLFIPPYGSPTQSDSGVGRPQSARLQICGRPTRFPAHLHALQRRHLRPVLTQFFNDKYSPVAVQSEKEVNFMLIYAGSLSSGMTDISLEASGKWGFEGNVHLVNREK